MTELEKLILHLQNLLKSNSKTATLDVKYLLTVLNALPNTEVKREALPQSTSVEVDGGSFRE